MSISSPLAVSMMIGTWLRARIRRQTSTPSSLGSIRSRMTRSKRSLGEAQQRILAVERGYDLVSVLSQRIAEKGLDRLLIVHEQDSGGALGHG